MGEEKKISKIKITFFVRELFYKSPVRKLLVLNKVKSSPSVPVSSRGSQRELRISTEGSILPLGLNFPTDYSFSLSFD